MGYVVKLLTPPFHSPIDAITAILRKMFSFNAWVAVFFD